MLFVAAIVPLILGTFLLDPAFSQKSPNYVLNLMIIIHAAPIGLFMIPLIVLDLGLLHTLCYITIPLSWLMGIVLLTLGQRNLRRIE